MRDEDPLFSGSTFPERSFCDQLEASNRRMTVAADAFKAGLGISDFALVTVPSLIAAPEIGVGAALFAAFELAGALGETGLAMDAAWDNSLDASVQDTASGLMSNPLSLVFGAVGSLLGGESGLANGASLGDAISLSYEAWDYHQNGQDLNSLQRLLQGAKISSEMLSTGYATPPWNAGINQTEPTPQTMLTPTQKAPGTTSRAFGTALEPNRVDQGTRDTFNPSILDSHAQRLSGLAQDMAAPSYDYAHANIPSVSIPQMLLSGPGSDNLPPNGLGPDYGGDASPDGNESNSQPPDSAILAPSSTPD